MERFGRDRLTRNLLIRQALSTDSFDSGSNVTVFNDQASGFASPNRTDGPILNVLNA
jgi:hypothetical protein